MQIIIFASDSATSLGLVRCLKNHKIVLLHCKKFSTSKYSKYVWKKILYENLDAKLLEFLIKDKSLHNSYIFPSEDENSDFILSNQSELDKFYIIPKSNYGNKILSKSFQKKIALKSKLNIPKEFDINSIKSENFPLILKPLDSLNYGKEHFKIYNNIEDFIKDKNNLNNNINYFAEEYIPGTARSMYEIIGYSDIEKDNFGFFGIRKIRQSPPKIGSSSFIESFDFTNDIKEKLKSFFKIIGYNGLFDTEFKFCSLRKKFYFIECNFRAGAPISFTNSNNFSLVNSYIQGYPFDIKLKRKLHWINDQVDYTNFKSELNFNIFLKDFYKSDAYAFFDKRDILPFLVMILKKFRL